MKVTGLNELAQYIEYEEIVRKHEKKAIKEIKKQKIKELVAEGVDEELAKVMTQAFMSCGL